MVESKLKDSQCGFRPGRSNADQIFTPKQIFEKSWEYGKDLFTCFVDLKKLYDLVPRDKLWKVLRELVYIRGGVRGHILKSLASDFFVSLALASSLVSSTPPLVYMALMVSCYVPINHSTTGRRFVFA